MQQSPVQPPAQTSKKKFQRPEPFRFKVEPTALLLLAVFLLGFLSAWLIWGRDSGQVAITGDSLNGQQVVRKDVSVDDDPSLGPTDAPITIVEFSDYQCPFCSRWHNEVFAAMMKKYEGKIRFVYRDFPLYQIHPEAEPAAIAANCAGEQGKYWEFNNLNFSGGRELGSETYLAYANSLGLDMAVFSACLTDTTKADEITADYQYASSLGVSSTPTFFINGIAVVGAQPLEVFSQVIESELKGKQ